MKMYALLCFFIHNLENLIGLSSPSCFYICIIKSSYVFACRLIYTCSSQVEGLMTDTSAAEEEINRWKVAAEQEAAAGKAVEQELLAQVRKRSALPYTIESFMSSSF